MKIIITGGGTAGHINPAISVANIIKKNDPNSKILYVGAKGGMEEYLVPKAGFDFVGINISGFSRKLDVKGIKNNIITIKNLFLSYSQSKKIVREFKPDICLGTGGYASGPVLREAGSKGIPYVIHDQNAFPGVTTKILSKKAKKVMLASKAAIKHLDKLCQTIVTGNPVRSEINKWTKEEAKKALNLDHRPTILSFGGSLGARKINEAVAELITWSSKNAFYNHIHAYGKYGKWFEDILRKNGVGLKNAHGIYVKEYIDDMPIRMAAADIVICRAGALTLSELEILGKPAILIPSPNVAENHQYHNAMELVNLNAASMIEEKDLTGEALIKKVMELLDNPDVIDQYSKNLKAISVNNADETIYSVICDILGNNQGYNKQSLLI